MEEVASDALLDVDAVALQWVLQRIESAGCHLNLVFLDCCRSKPPAMASGSKALSRGLAKIDAPTGTLVSFACAPGSTASDGGGRNGPYTACLLKHLPRPEDVQKVLGYVVSGVQEATNGAQVPWMSGALARNPQRNNGDIYLIEPAAQVVPRVSPAEADAAMSRRDSSQTALDKARETGADVEALTQWLGQCGLDKHEASVIPKLVAMGVFKVHDLLELEESDISSMDLLTVQQKKLKKAVSSFAEEHRAKAKADAERVEAERRANEREQEARNKAQASVVQQPLSGKAQEYFLQMQGKSELRLSGTGIGDSDANALAEAIKVNTALTKLNLFDNSIGDAGASALAEALKMNKTLMALSIICNNIGDASKQALKSSARNGCTVYG